MVSTIRTPSTYYLQSTKKYKKNKTHEHNLVYYKMHEHILGDICYLTMVEITWEALIWQSLTWQLLTWQVLTLQVLTLFVAGYICIWPYGSDREPDKTPYKIYLFK